MINKHVKDFHLARRRKTKLSTLTNLFLERDIQVSGPDGHCPEEDARAALELTLLKLKVM